MKLKLQQVFRVALVFILAATILLMSVPLAWAGPVSGTIPTAVPSPLPTGGPGLLWSFITNLKNCPISCVLTELTVAAVPPAPRGVTFVSASSLSGFNKGFLRYTVRVCFQTTDRKTRLYYYETFIRPNRWVRLPITVRSATQVCTNVRFANATFAAGH